MAWPKLGSLLQPLSAFGRTISIEEYDAIVAGATTPEEIRTALINANIIKVPPSATLATLTLSSYSVSEDAEAGSFVGTIRGKKAGSSIALTGNAGGRFAISGDNVITGSTALDYETNTSHSITLTETLEGAVNSPRATTLTINVLNVFEAPALGTLTLSDDYISSGEEIELDILGATEGSTIHANILPPGLTLDSEARTISGTADYGDTYNIQLTETLADSPNSPRSSQVYLEVGSAPIPTPGDIEDLAVVSVTTTMAQLSFTDATNADGYEYLVAGGSWTPLPGDRQITTGLSPYPAVNTVTVRGVNVVNVGEPSNAVEVVLADSIELQILDIQMITGELIVGSEVLIAITGATPGSEITVWGGSLPPDLILDSEARTIHGTLTQLGDFFFRLQETLEGASNSPNVSTTPLGIPVGEGAPDPYQDPDLNKAYAFQQEVLSHDGGSGDRALQLFASFDALKEYLNVGVKSENLTPASEHPNWNVSNKRLDAQADSTISEYDIDGFVYIGPGTAGNVTVENCLIREAQEDYYNNYKVHKQNSDEFYTVNVVDCTLRYGQAATGALVNMNRVLHEFSTADNFKIANMGGPGRVQRIENVWGQFCGYNNPAAHGDGFQSSSGGDVRIVAVGLYSVTEESDYSTNSYGLTNALRIDASNSNQRSERIHALGVMSAFGGFYPISISPQKTDSIVRNVTVAHWVLAPATFSGRGADISNIHPSLTSIMTDAYVGSGLIENIGFYGNVIFGVGPLTYNDRGAGDLDVTGIWHWNKGTLDATTAELWRDLGLLDANNDPMPGMLRSVAGDITTHTHSVPGDGDYGLGIDISTIPDGTTVKLHLPGPYVELEYDIDAVSEPDPDNVTTVMVMGQSEMNYILLYESHYNQITKPVVPETSNLIVWTQQGGPDNPAVRTVVTQGTVNAGLVNPAMGAVSSFLDYVLPGKKFAIGDGAVGGTSRYGLMDDTTDATDERQWSTFADVADAMETEFGAVDLLVENWYNSDAAHINNFRNNFWPFYFGANPDGSYFELGGLTPNGRQVDHCLWDASAPEGEKGRGLFSKQQTAWAVNTPMPFHGAPTAPDPELQNFSANNARLTEPSRANMIVLASDPLAQAVSLQVGPSAHVCRFGGGSTEIHPDQSNPDGQVLLAWPIAVAIARRAGLEIGEPTIVDITGPTNGSYVDIIVNLPNGGNLTTLSALRGTTYTGSAPHQQDVTGIELSRSAERKPVFRTTETERPEAYRGTVEIVDAGSGNPRRGKVRVTPEIPFAFGDSVSYLRGQATAVLLKPRDIDLYPWFLIEHVPAFYDESATYPMEGIAVRPYQAELPVPVPGGDFEAQAAHFDGDTDYHSNNFPNVEAGDKGMVSVWFRNTSGAWSSSTPRRVFEFYMGNIGVFSMHLGGANRITFKLNNDTSTDNHNYYAALPNIGHALDRYYHMAAVWGDGAITIFVDGQQVYAFNYTSLDMAGQMLTRIGVGAGVSGGNKWIGDIGHLYINLTDNIDLTVPENMLKLRNEDGPVALGSNGQFVTGNIPEFYFDGVAPDWINRGTAGNITVTGALTPSDTPPGY